MNIHSVDDRLRLIRELASHLEAGAPSTPAPDVADGQPIVLFGAGPLGQMTLAHLRHMGTLPVALTDNNQRRWGTTLDGVPILAPADAVRRYAGSARFVVTIYNGSAVRCQLQEMGCAAVEHFADIFFRYPEEFLPFCGLANRGVVLDSWSEAANAAKVWFDARSTTEYLAQLAWRLRLPGCDVPRHDSPAECYFPQDLFHLIDDEVFVDCGAFDGDSLRQYLSRRSSIGRSTVLALEPDGATFARLADYVRGLPSEVGGNIRIEPWAVAEKSGRVGFSALGSVRSVVEQSGTASVVGVALDEVGIMPSLIKMDVEGFELAALKGAAALLRRHKPVLAISLYHHASDLWTIPNFLKALVPEYNFFLRRYAEDCWELVLYAIPSSRMLGGVGQAPSGVLHS
jgi:FkbM family methyltransferase